MRHRMIFDVDTLARHQSQVVPAQGRTESADRMRINIKGERKTILLKNWPRNIFGSLVAIINGDHDTSIWKRSLFCDVIFQCSKWNDRDFLNIQKAHFLFEAVD